jgi:hypothetical protein
MTESEWQTCADPAPMLAFLRRRASERKLRLFAVACSRRMMHLITDDSGRRAITLAERFADGRVREQDCAVLRQHIQELKVDRVAEREFFGALLLYAVQGGIAQAEGLLNTVTKAAKHVAEVIGSDEWHRVLEQASPRAQVAREGAGEGGWSPQRQREADQACRDVNQRERHVQADLVREIFGNPFRPAAIDPGWLRWNDGTVPRLARVIYEERDFETLPVLADALEDAGCTEVALLQHCRSGAAHVRGCWAVDAILGKV